jgi:hypothetical protein
MYPSNERRITCLFWLAARRLLQTPGTSHSNVDEEAGAERAALFFNGKKVVANLNFLKR